MRCSSFELHSAEGCDGYWTLLSKFTSYDLDDVTIMLQKICHEGIDLNILSCEYLAG